LLPNDTKAMSCIDGVVVVRNG